MILATVSSWSCFCWLFIASPSSAAKNIISLILVLTIWWFPCVEFSLMLLEKGAGYGQFCQFCILLAKLCKPLPCFILYSKAKLACYSRYLLTSYFCISVPDDEKDIFFGVSSKRSCGEGNGNPLQYSCLENPMDGGAWLAAIHGVEKSRAELSLSLFTFMHWRREWQPTPV